MQQHVRTLFGLVFAAGLLAGCNSDNDHTPAATTPVQSSTVNVKVVHAAVDAPAVNVTSASAINLRGLSFASSSAAVQLPVMGGTVVVDAVLPDGSSRTVLTPQLAGLQAGMDYVVLAVGKVADGSLSSLLVPAAATVPTSGNALVQVVHAASGAPTVDVHLTAPGVPLGSGTVTATLPFKQFTGRVSVPAGNYQIRITPAGNATAVVFDSGPINISSGSNLLVAALDNRFAGNSPVSLLAVEPNGNSAEIKDVNSPSAIRVVHAVADAPAVDVLLNNQKAISALQFPRFTGYANVAAATYNSKVAASADNSVVVIDANLALTAGSFNTVVATGLLAANSIKPWVLADTPRRIATAAQVRIGHASAATGNVDIYVTASRDISAATPAFRNVAFLNETGYVALLPGSYVVTVTPTGSKNAAIGPVTLELAGNKIYTALARDGEANSGPGLILLDDFN